MKRIPHLLLLCSAACMLSACGGTEAASPVQSGTASGTRVVVAQQTEPAQTTTTCESANTTTSAGDDFLIDLNTYAADETGAAERGMPLLTEIGDADAAEPPVTTVSVNPENAVLHLISFPAVVRRNEDVTLTAKGKPETEYRIHVYYTSGASSAEGLEPLISDTDGNMSWTWQIGGKTRAGSFHIDITGGEELLSIPLLVAED